MNSLIHLSWSTYPRLRFPEWMRLCMKNNPFLQPSQSNSKPLLYTGMYLLNSNKESPIEKASFQSDDMQSLFPSSNIKFRNGRSKFNFFHYKITHTLWIVPIPLSNLSQYVYYELKGGSLTPFHSFPFVWQFQQHDSDRKQNGNYTYLQRYVYT